MYHVGIDLHRRYLVAEVVDKRGSGVTGSRLPNDEGAVLEFLNALDGPVRVALESTGNWPWLYDLLDSEGIETKLAHPQKVKAIGSAKLKNDKVDGRMLAQLLRTDLLPESYVPPREVRQWRELVRYRAALVRIQTGLKNRIRALLAKRNLTLDSATLMSRAARSELAALSLPVLARQQVDQSLELLDHLASCVRELDREIRLRAGEQAEADLLRSVPGIGYYRALLILGEIGEIERFPSARKLASYAGLVPTTRSSGGHTYHGRITKQGSVWLRWAMIQAAMHAVRRPGPLQRFYEKQRRRKGTKIARVAAARKLLMYVYWMLKNEETYTANLRRTESTGACSSLHLA